MGGGTTSAASPASAPEGLGVQQQVKVEAAGPAAAAMKVDVDGGAADFEREAQAPEPGNKPFFYLFKYLSK
jgi:hypothetical protein